MKRILCATILGLIAVMLLVSTASAVTLTNYWFLNRESLQYKYGIGPFMKAVTERTNGEIKFKDFCCGELGDDVATLEQTRKGSIDVRTCGLLLYGRYEEKIDNIGLPFLFRDYEHVRKFISSPLFYKVTESLTKVGLQPITCFNAGFRDMQSVKKRVDKPENIKGLKIVSAPIKVWTDFWSTAGAHPQTLPPAEFYMAMKTNVVDCAIEAGTNCQSYKMNETIKYYNKLQWAWMGPLMVMNKKRWDSLSEKHQKIIREEAIRAAMRTFDEGERINDEAIKWLEKKGVTVTWKPDRKAWEPLVKATYSKMKEGVGWYDQKIIDAIRAIK